MATETSVVSYGPLVYRLRTPLGPIVDRELDRLSVIVLRQLQNSANLTRDHQGELERKIILWGSVVTELKMEGKTDETIVEVLSEKVNDLMDNIFISPLTYGTYRDPVRFHGWVLDKNDLKVRKEFDGHPITDPNDYPRFSHDIIDWLNDLNTKLRLLLHSH